MATYITDSQAKAALVDIGKRVHRQGYVAGNDGNFSVKVSDDILWVTPTGVSKGYMDENMMVKMRLDGAILEGSAKPSSEVKMHLAMYRENAAIKAVVHAHPTAATSFAIAGIPLDLPIMVEAAIMLGIVPVVKYAAPGTPEVGEYVVPFCKDYAALLLSNHGTLTWGTDLTQAFFRLEALENYAKTTLNLMALGKARLFSKAQMQEVSGIKAKFGITDGVLPEGADTEQNTSSVLKSDSSIV